MLHEKAYINPGFGVWGTFERERPRLNRQELEPCFVDGSGLSPSLLKKGFYELRDSLSHESCVIRKARLFEYLLLNGRIAVDGGDWFADKLDHQNLMADYNKAAMTLAPAHYSPEARDRLEAARAAGYYEGAGLWLDTGHISPGWRYMYAKGLSGLLDDARKARASFGTALTPEQADFYDSLGIVYNAIIAFAARLAEMAGRKAQTGDAGAEARLLSVAGSLANVPQNPPGDFHEALQCTFLMHQMIELEGEMVRSMGGFDRNFFGYYDADIKAGKLDEARAKELIQFFFTKFYAHTRGAANGKNFYFGGQRFDGTNAENALTYIALEAYHQMNTTDPKLSVRFYKHSTDRLYRQVAESIRAGRTAFVLVNDETAVPAIQARGKTLEEAREYLLIGCYEPAIEGKEAACNMALSINLAKGVELALNRGVDIATGTRLGPDTGDPLGFGSYEDFENAYLKQLSSQVEDAALQYSRIEGLWPFMNPSPVVAGTFPDAVRSGRDIGQCGPKYNNTGCMGAGIASAVDSLSAIKTAVFDEKICTMETMLDALRNNFGGHEKLRLYVLNRIPRWGNADPAADSIAGRVIAAYCSCVNALSNGRGGKYAASLFSLDHRYSLGKHTAALPCGRGNGEPLSLNNAASPGKDTEGVTALLQSATSLDYQHIPNGSVTDVYLHPSAVSGGDGLDAFISLVKTYFSRGGYGIQFNIFDRETLKDAQQHPEKYQTLQIRVCGWNVYFVTMSAFEQEQYISANIHAM